MAQSIFRADENQSSLNERAIVGDPSIIMRVRPESRINPSKPACARHIAKFTIDQWAFAGGKARSAAVNLRQALATGQ